MSTPVSNEKPAQLAPPRSTRPAASRSSSAKSVKSAIGHFTESVRPSVSKRDSQTELPAPVHYLDAPTNAPREHSSDNLRSGLAGPMTGKGPADTLIPGAAITEVLAGQTGKSFKVHTDLLKSRSPYFASLLSPSTPRTPPSSPTSSFPQQFAFPDLDEFAFALWVRWLYGTDPRGPTDYHSMQHYISLYLLAATFRCERLQNGVMDHVRAYYRAHGMTAPAYRLEYVFDRTPAGRPNHLRRFLVYTAAYRYLCEREPKLSDAMRAVLAKGGDLAVEFAEALAVLHHNELVDVRRGPDCAFHEHVETPPCKPKVAEAYE